MRLAVLSDTHLVEPTDSFKRFFDEHVVPADAVIHCGDISGKPLLDYMLASHPQVYAVAGNMCQWPLGRDLPPTLSLNLAGKRVGVTHGWGEKLSLATRVYEAFGPGFDILFFGHTHKPDKVVIGKTLLVNPGSFSGQEPCMAFVELDDTIRVDFRRFPGALAT
ncbi:metallophosphoesterase [Fundidesulfovibrio butyratiphilus]